MKLIIAGSRTFKLESPEIYNLIAIHKLDPTIIICGCGSTDYFKVAARETLYTNDERQWVSSGGIDLAGEKFARYHEIKIIFKPAQWTKLGKIAGPVRNAEMAKIGEVLLLIWDGKSKGSVSMKKEMQKLNKPIYEVILTKENI